MKNPDLYVVIEDGTMDTETWDVGSNIESLKEKAARSIQQMPLRRETTIYRLVPVVKFQLEVKTSVIEVEIVNGNATNATNPSP